MKICYYVGISILICASSAAGVFGEEWSEFKLEWRESPEEAVVDLSYLLDEYAGVDGRIRAQDGYLLKENGERFRIWGINVSSRACFPEKELAPKVAKYLARMGINCVRFHHMDNPWTEFLAGEEGTSRKLNQELLDRLDYFIYQLKQEGIYTNLNLNVARRFEKGDEVKDYKLLGYAKGLTFFDPRLIYLQKEYARQLLTHRNPYTKTRYSKEPAVVIVEIVNENSLLESWFNGRLLGENTEEYPGTWTDIPESYAKDLDLLYNIWLEENVSREKWKRIREEAGVKADEQVPRLRPEQFGKTSDLRFRTETAFYMDVEETYFQDMKDFLKDELDVQAAIVGTADHNHYRSSYPHIKAMSMMDVMDGHVYWQHPNYKEGRVGGRRRFEMDNTPMVNNPYFSTVVQLSRSAMEGKPYTVSETNHPYPNEYACEGVPILGAYAMLQDWDGIFFYTLEHSSPGEWENRMDGHFDFRPDPMKMANIATAGLMFLRGDVKPAKECIVRDYSPVDVKESLRLSYKERPYFTPGFSLTIPLKFRTRIGSLEEETTVFDHTDESKQVLSDTEELFWSIDNPKGKGFVTIDTPKAQAIIGFVNEFEGELKNCDVDMDTEFCALQWMSLDDKAIENSDKILLTATARALNKGTEWNADHTSLEDWGDGPMRIELVKGTIALRGLDDAKGVEVVPLNGLSKPMDGSIEVKKDDNGEWTFEIGDHATLWYEINVRR